MNEKTKNIIELFIAIFGCCLAVFTLFFGDNLYQQITGRSILQNLPSPTITSFTPPAVENTSTNISVSVTETATTLLSSETPIPTPTVPTAKPKDLSVNCRQGPGVQWEAISVLVIGKSAPIVGKSSDLQWWYIADPYDASQHCWLMASVIIAEGDLTTVPVVASP